MHVTLKSKSKRTLILVLATACLAGSVAARAKSRWRTGSYRKPLSYEISERKFEATTKSEKGQSLPSEHARSRRSIGRRGVRGCRRKPLFRRLQGKCCGQVGGFSKRGYFPFEDDSITNPKCGASTIAEAKSATAAQVGEWDCHCIPDRKGGVEDLAQIQP